MYDRSKVGKRIGSGADSIVYQYGENQVIKFSSLHLLIGKKMRQKLRADYKLCKEYFNDFIVETEEVGDANSSQHIEIQAYVKGVPLQAKHVRNPEVREQLERIITALEKMEKEGHAPIDLIGYSGLLTRSLHNVLIDEKGKLRIIDATLFETQSVGGIGLLFVPLFPLIIAGQKRMLKSFLKK
ncbi:hypothetical protein H0X32_00525 [Patescibacteria group bacterium]|nr:hypothetical protein [Patescibacteria group bacterium]